MAGLHIRVGIEDTPWKHPNSNTLLKNNLEMFNMARDLAALLGRAPASANDYRKLIGKPELSTSARPKVSELARA
jgi:3-keto-5-aminohexanoate cleavage enzyme